VTSSPDDAFDDYLDAVLVGGREERELVLVDYQPAWAAQFAVERVGILKALGDVARRVEHVGSTAVPDLAAKPIVDILVVVDDPDDEDGYVRSFEEAGYLLRVREPGHRMFRTPGRDVHVHVWKAGSDDERRQLLFRDWLRQNRDDRVLYEGVKRQFIGENFTDMNYYARAKGPVIEDIMRRAEAWTAERQSQSSQATTPNLRLLQPDDPVAECDAGYQVEPVALGDVVEQSGSFARDVGCRSRAPRS
jgi:GrpB-like predicted nucleotidyltransferase (UPF0157 family)